MPATRANRLDNPLRKLRLILSEDGETPLSQEEFATRIGLSLATLRAIEAGRRPLSDDCQLYIYINLSARWNSRKGQWCVLDSDVPYEKKHAEFAEALDPKDPYVDDYYVHRLLERILAMFKGCPSRQHRRGLLMYLSRHLKETAEGFGIPAKDLKPTEPRWGITRNPKLLDKPLGKEAVFWAVYPHASSEISPHLDEGGIFDFRSHRTFRAVDYPEGKTPSERDEIVQERTADKEPPPEKKEILTAPIPHPT